MSYQPSISKFFRPNNKSTAKKDANSSDVCTASKVHSTSEDLGSPKILSDNQNCKHNSTSVTTELEVKPRDTIEKPQVTKPMLSGYHFAQTKDATGHAIGHDSEKSLHFSEKLQSALKKRSSRAIDRETDRESSLDAQEEQPQSKKSKKNDKLTPLDQQVKDLKLQHMDKVLAVRVGYKYKFFAMDAVIVSKILQIMLIGGKLTLDDSHPGDRAYKQLAYCSIPDNRLQVHIQRLLHHNLKVGVVEQTETQAIKKANGSSSGVFRRQVDKVFTKATFSINENFSRTQINPSEEINTIWALRVDEDDQFYHFWLFSVQLSSGEVIYDQFSDNKKLMKLELEKRISYLQPIEIVSKGTLSPLISTFIRKRQPDVQFHDYDSLLPDVCEDDQVEGLNLEKELLELRNTLRRYLENYNTEKVMDIPHNYKPFHSKTNMILSSNTLESLEIFENQTDGTSRGSLMWLLDHTRTSFGYRLLREWISRPLTDKDSINERLDAVECTKQEVTNIFMEALGNVLKDTPDFLRNLNRIYYGQTSRSEVYNFLKHLDKVAKHFTSHHYYLQEQVFSSSGRVHQKSKLMTSLLQRLDDGLKEVNTTNLLNMINVSGALEKDKEKSCVEFFNLNNYDNADVILSKLKDIESVKEELQIELGNIRRLLKRPRFCYKDEIEFLIEVRNTQLTGLPTDWIKVGSTKMVSRFKTPKTTKLVDQLDYHKNLLVIICDEQFKRFLANISSQYLLLKEVIENLATFDCMLSLAATSFNRQYVRPQFCEGRREMKIRNGRNPIIESLDVNYVANDVYMKEDQSKLLIITGPNMGGKSSFIRQVALISILAQVGSFVPAESANLPIFSNIFTRIGAHDNLIKGDSTFKVEMLEMLDILKNSDENSLLLLDEVGRGTGTTDGISISDAIINYFIDMDKKCPFILFITHYPILGSIKSPLIENYHMGFIEERRAGEKWPTAVFLYKLTQGIATDSYGLNVARLANLPMSIINNAYVVSEGVKAEMEAAKNLRFTSKLSAILTKKDTSSCQKIKNLLELGDII